MEYVEWNAYGLLAAVVIRCIHFKVCGSLMFCCISMQALSDLQAGKERPIRTAVTL